MRIQTRDGAPTPDDLDELITRVWKEPAFFLAHPLPSVAFGRECTYRGVPPATVNLFGSPFITWRGIPLIPSDKLYVNNGQTNILLMRTGEKRQGVVDLFQPGLPGEGASRRGTAGDPTHNRSERAGSPRASPFRGLIR